MAVGNYDTGPGGSLPVAERWDGSSWTLLSAASPPGAENVYLDGVSCISPSACSAVGTYYNGASVLATLAETWDGSEWAIQATPNPGATYGDALERVSCRSAAVCTATGLSYTDSTGGSVTLVEAWNGTSWTVRHTPTPAGATEAILFGVSCTSSTTCTAVGDSYNGTALRTLAERH